MEHKQVIVLRKDLNMRKGKMIAQGAHASCMAVLDGQNCRAALVEEWVNESFGKICVQASSEAQLLELYEAAKTADLLTALVTDAGFTEFHGIPTNTCIAIGPGYCADIDRITGHLKLL